MAPARLHPSSRPLPAPQAELVPVKVYGLLFLQEVKVERVANHFHQHFKLLRNLKEKKKTAVAESKGPSKSDKGENGSLGINLPALLCSNKCALVSQCLFTVDEDATDTLSRAAAIASIFGTALELSKKAQKNSRVNCLDDGAVSKIESDLSGKNCIGSDGLYDASGLKELVDFSTDKKINTRSSKNSVGYALENVNSGANLAEETAPVFTALTHLICHPNWMIREITLHKIRHVVSSIAPVFTCLLHAMAKIVFRASEKMVAEERDAVKSMTGRSSALLPSSNCLISPSAEVSLDLRREQYHVMLSGKPVDSEHSSASNSRGQRLGQHFQGYGSISQENFVEALAMLFSITSAFPSPQQGRQLMQYASPLRFVTSCEWNIGDVFVGENARFVRSKHKEELCEPPACVDFLPVLALLVHHPFVSGSYRIAWNNWRNIYMKLCELHDFPSTTEPANLLASSVEAKKDTLQLTKSQSSGSNSSVCIEPSGLDLLLQRGHTMNAFTSWLMSTSGVLSPNRLFRQASQGLLSSLASGVFPFARELCGSQDSFTGTGGRHIVFCKILPWIFRQLDSLLQDELTDVTCAARSVFKSRKLTDDISPPSIACGIGGSTLNEISIWQAPQGQLVDIASSSRQIEYRRNRNIKKNRVGKKRAQRLGISSFGGDDDAEEEFSPIQESSSSTQSSEEFKAKLHYQDSVRVYVQLMYDRIANSLETLDTIVRHNPGASSTLMDLVFPRLCHLLQSSVGMEPARQSMKTLYEALSKNNLRLPKSLEKFYDVIVAIQKMSEYNLDQRCRAVVQRVKELRDAALQSFDTNMGGATSTESPSRLQQDNDPSAFYVFLPEEADDIQQAIEKCFPFLSQIVSYTFREATGSICVPIILSYVSSFPLSDYRGVAYRMLSEQIGSARDLTPRLGLSCGHRQLKGEDAMADPVAHGFDIVWSPDIGDLVDIQNCRTATGILQCITHIGTTDQGVASQGMVKQCSVTADMATFFRYLAARCQIFSVLLSLTADKLMLEPSPSELLESLCKVAPSSASEGVILPAELYPVLISLRSISKVSDVRIVIQGCLEKVHETYEESITAVCSGEVSSGTEEIWKAAVLVLVRLFMSRFDPEESLKERAERFWEQYNLSLPRSSWQILKQYIGASDNAPRTLIGDAIAGFLLVHRDQIPNTLADLKSAFEEGEDDGPDISHEQVWKRCSVLACFDSMCRKQVLERNQLLVVLKFLVQRGLADMNSDVRLTALDTCLNLVDMYGQSQCEDIMRFVEDFMAHGHQSDIAAKDESSFDFQREGTVLMLGAAAKHLEDTDAKVLYAIHTLVDASRNTPSEPVQRSVARCLPPLVKKQKSEMHSTFSNILAVITGAETYGERRGAAYALAGCVKGAGISVLRSMDIISTLEEAAQDRTVAAREGAIVSFECLFDTLKMLFEPYIVRIVPLLLKAYSDDKEQVRDVAEEASKVIMGNLTSHGVKLVLPSLLKGTQDVEWRSKRASLTLLGNMAYCAPKQLSKALPQIVPRLIESFTDTHPKVQSACRRALSDIGEVIQNPEIAQLVPKLINALANPSEATNDCLSSLSESAFSHAIDPASLALVMPVIRRGLRERSAATKRKACVLVSNISSLVSNPEDIVPYLPLIIPVLKKVCIDPIPDVRHSAANALGSLASGIGFSTMEEYEISTWLWETMQSSTSVAERSGAAQASCAYYWAQSSGVFENWLNDVLKLNTSDSPLLKEGYFWTLASLPSTLEGQFSRYIESVLPNVVAGMSDDRENIRDVAFQAGKMILERHCLTDTEKILPTLKNCLFDKNWRIRESCITLLSLLLQRVGGVKASGSSGPAVNTNSTMEDNYKADISKPFGESDSFLSTIAEHIGEEELSDCLSSLFLVRFDLSNVVRQAAVKEWKDLVNHPPRTLHDILSPLTHKILALLCSEEEDHRIIASKCLGDVMKKIGETVLKEIVPLLSEGLESNNMKTIQGVCFGISELARASTKRSVEEYFLSLVPHIRTALSHDKYQVQEAAAEAFSALHERLGDQIVQSTIPNLLDEINDPDAEKSSRALRGLKEMLSQDKGMVDYLVPRLTVAPLSEYHLRALAAISEISGDVLRDHFKNIIPAIIKTLCAEHKGKPTDDDVESILESDLAGYATSTLLSVNTESVQLLLRELVGKLEEQGQHRKWVCLWILGEFCAGKEVSYYEDLLPMLLKEVLYTLADGSHPKTLQQAWNSLNSLATACGPDRLVNHMRFINDCISSAVSEAKNRAGFLVSDQRNVHGEFEMPGFSMKKGIEPLLPVYQKALLHGDSQTRETAARGLGIVVNSTNADALKPYFIKITGPLIRTVGDKFPASVKQEILKTLRLVMEKGGVALKPFLPQLQTTFVRTLNDANKTVRSESAGALGQLMHLAPRVDPLINELCNNITSAVGGIKDAMLEALFKVIRNAGAKVSGSFRAKARDLLLRFFEDEDDLTRTLVGMSLGAMLAFMDASDENASVILERLLEEAPSSGYQHTQVHCVRMAFKQGHPSHLVYLLNQGILDRLHAAVGSGSYVVQEATGATLGVILSWAGANEDNAELRDAVIAREEELKRLLLMAMRSSVKDVRRLAVLSVARVNKNSNILRSATNLSTFLPVLARCLQDTNNGVKGSAEYCVTIYLRVQRQDKFDELLNRYQKSGSADEGILAIFQQFARRPHKHTEQEEHEDSDDEFL
eukprot:gb/GECG01013949.1/.p1 GENE.gb/GECG01013949.1/~~gb/GECG01013949.1/.p1  ORF type:complete len:2694 (+),score=312.58 gb/GECG01013949.1/:1-8082(+)